MINLHERMLPTRRGSNPQPPDHQSDAHPTEPPKPVQCMNGQQRTGWYFAHVKDTVNPHFFYLFIYLFINLFIYFFFLFIHFFFLCACSMAFFSLDLFRWKRWSELIQCADIHVVCLYQWLWAETELFGCSGVDKQNAHAGFPKPWAVSTEMRILMGFTD